MNCELSTLKDAFDDDKPHNMESSQKSQSVENKHGTRYRRHFYNFLMSGNECSGSKFKYVKTGAFQLPE